MYACDEAIACALDKSTLINALWRGQAVPAETLLPKGHWAAADDAGCCRSIRNDICGRRSCWMRAGMETRQRRCATALYPENFTTDETTRLLAQAVQQQLRSLRELRWTLLAGQRSSERSMRTSPAARSRCTCCAGLDRTKTRTFFATRMAQGVFRPRAAIAGAIQQRECGRVAGRRLRERRDVAARRRDYVEVQQILATELPGIPLWYPNVEVVHSTRLTGVTLNPGGTFDFLRTAELH